MKSRCWYVANSDAEMYIVYAHCISFSKGLRMLYIDTSVAHLLTRRLRSWVKLHMHSSCVLFCLIVLFQMGQAPLIDDWGCIACLWAFHLPAARADSHIQHEREVCGRDWTWAENKTNITDIVVASLLKISGISMLQCLELWYYDGINTSLIALTLHCK